jgi:tetratricopeptide (TPR) repeat protein
MSREPAPTATALTADKSTADKPAVGKSSMGSSAAEKLAAQAHHWSTSAESDTDFTRIIETCRRARASQASAPVAKYVNLLAAWALNRRGQLKAEAGQIKEALLDFDDAIRADANCWRAVHNRGVLLAQDGQFEKAFDDFNRTIEINPEFAKAYSNRGALFVVANDLDAALADYGRAIQLDPNLAIAHRGRGRACHLLGRLDEAIGHYDAAVQLAPDDGYAVASRADLLTDLGRYVDALEEYNHAIEMDPQSLHAYSGSAWLLATCPDNSVRDPELAVERARTAIELSGQADAVNFDTLAAAQASAGNFTAATKTVRQAIELASEAERDVYHERLLLYQHARPYRIAPVRPVTQASYESIEQEAGSRE